MRNSAFLAAVAAAFAAASPLTAVRAQVAGYDDVPKGHWAAESVTKLAAAGIIKGDSPDPLGPSAKSPQTGGKKAAYDGTKPVTRYELAVTLYRFVQYIEHADKMKKGKVQAMAAPLDGAAAVKRLIAEGYLPKTTPLAKDGTKPITADQMADALAQVIAKSRENTTPVTPDSEKGQIEKPTEAPKGA